jgi:glycerophosphoryl diester phosphodiesterase
VSALRTRALRRVGHKGADRIVPGNTLASFAAARAAGVDMIEFDVLPAPGGGGLVLAHNAEDAARRDPLTLEAGLAHLAGPDYAGVELDVDLKLPGYELEALAALRRFGLVERTLVSTMHRASLAVLRRAEPRLRLGWSVPRVHRDYRDSAWARVPAALALSAYRRSLPARAAAALRAGACDALMAHHAVVTAGLVRAVHEAGGELYVWTVDDRDQISALDRLGVTGVITNDPRLFAARAC